MVNLDDLNCIDCAIRAYCRNLESRYTNVTASSGSDLCSVAHKKYGMPLKFNHKPSFTHNMTDTKSNTAFKR